MAIADGIIIPWLGEHANIPAGWSRITDLDSRYLRSIPDESTNPGANGGSATHLHTTPGHTHDLSHSHGSATSTALTANTNAQGGVDAQSVGTHTHPFTLSSQTVTSGSAAPNSTAVSNELGRLEVIWLESDGTPTAFPAGTLLFTADSEDPRELVAGGRYLRGAADSQDGGDEEDSTLASHAHGVEDHTHEGAPHSHPSTNSGGPSATAGPVELGGSARSGSSHVHPVSSNSVSTGETGNPTGGSSGTSSPEPPYEELGVVEPIEEKPQIGDIFVWLRTLSEIPDGYLLCNGENETPNLCHGKFIKSAAAAANIGNSGGTSTHAHTGITHAHTIGSHTHSATFGSQSSTSNISGSGVSSSLAHSTVHNATSAAATPTVGNASTGDLATASHIPLFTEVAFIMYVGEKNAGAFFPFF